MIEEAAHHPSGLENVYIGLANGEHLWADMMFFQSWNSRRHCRTHIFCGILTILFGFFVVFFNPFDRPNYGTQVIAGVFYFVAGIFSVGFRSPRATARICTLTTFVGIFIITEVLGKQMIHEASYWPKVLREFSISDWLGQRNPLFYWPIEESIRLLVKSLKAIF